MRRRAVQAAFTVALIVDASAAIASDQCEVLPGRSISPVSIEAVIASVSKFPHTKGEYESTATFQQRVDTAQRQAASSYFVSAPLDLKYIKYDADAGNLEIEIYAFKSGNTNFDGILGAGSEHSDIEYDSYGAQVDISFPAIDTKSGSYLGRNAFGTTVRIDKIRRQSKAVFEKSLHDSFGNMFYPSIAGKVDELPKAETSLFTIPMQPDRARVIKPTLRAVFLIVPKPPFYAYGKVYWKGPTLDNPTELDENLQLVFADIKCALLTDATGAVLAAKPVR